MAGTREGSRKAAATFEKRYGVEYRVKNGRKGGKAGGGKGGFTNNSELARRAGTIGGKISKRVYTKKEVTE